MLWARVYRKSSCTMELTRCRMYSGVAASTSKVIIRLNEPLY